MSSEAVPPMRTSPISRRPPPAERLGDDLEPDAARGLDEHDVARRAPAARASAAAAAASARGVRLAVEAVEHRRRPRPDGDQHVDPGGRRVGADLRVVLALGGPELEHVAEHRDAASGGLLHGEVVEGGAHGERVGVVAVVDDGRAAAERDALAPQRARSARPRARPGAPRPPARRPPRPACCAGCGASRTAARARSARPRRRRRGGRAGRPGPCRRAASCPRSARRRPART